MKWGSKVGQRTLRVGVTHAVAAFVGAVFSCGVLHLGLNHASAQVLPGGSHGAAPEPAPEVGGSDRIRMSMAEYCRHVALATLATQDVVFDENTIRIRRDPTRTGSAMEQFAGTFGSAIELRRSPEGLRVN